MTDTSRYICFNLGNEEFAIPLLSVKEVIGYPEITTVPQSPPHFLGIMNLRGQVISVMDLRLRLGIKGSRTEETTIIILDLGQNQLGVVVDQVNSVHQLTKEEIADKPVIESSKANEFITGVFRNEKKLILLLDLPRALSVEDHAALNKQKNKAA